MYTRAIDLCNNDSVFYSNRSQCYLSLEKYSECITDANRAIELDPKATKAFYRRMTAHEKLGEDYKALQSCRIWLDLAPEDSTAKNSYDRIINRITETEKKKDQERIRWSRYTPNTEIVSFVHRPPHLRSKKPMTNVTVNPSKAFSPIPASVIDRIFDNNTGEASGLREESNSKLFHSNFLIKPKAEKAVIDVKNITVVQAIKEKTEPYIINKNLESFEGKKHKMPSAETLQAEYTHLITIPHSGPQFFAAWKELNDIQRFLYLKNIVDNDVPIGKLLGVQLNSLMLSEIVHVVHTFFMFFNVPFVKMLADLRMNTEISLLVLFMEADDKRSISFFIFFIKTSLTLNSF